MIARLVALIERLLHRHEWVLVVDPKRRRTYLVCVSCHAETPGLVV